MQRRSFRKGTWWLRRIVRRGRLGAGHGGRGNLEELTPDEEGARKDSATAVKTTKEKALPYH